MQAVDLKKLKLKLALCNVLYLILFGASLAMLVMKSPAILFAVTLGAAVLVRVVVASPLSEKYTD